MLPIFRVENRMLVMVFSPEKGVYWQRLKDSNPDFL